MNLLHDIDPGTRESMNVIIEIPKGSHNKYEIDKETGLIKLDRVLHSAQDYPFDYGFVPQTLWDDGDALDVVVLATYPLVPGIVVDARPVAIMHMVDGGEADEKVIAVPVNDPRWNDVKDVADLNKHWLKEVTHFFATYKQVQGKQVEVGEFENRAAAEVAFDRARKMYEDKKNG